MHRVHADTVGQLPTPGTGGERYFVTAVEEFSNYCEVLPVQLKSSIPGELIQLLLRWETETEQKLKCVRTDRGTEFHEQDVSWFLC